MSARDEHLLIVWDAETPNIVEGRVTGSREGDEYEVLLEAASEDELTVSYRRTARSLLRALCQRTACSAASG